MCSQEFNVFASSAYLLSSWIKCLLEAGDTDHNCGQEYKLDSLSLELSSLAPERSGFYLLCSLGLYLAA